MISWQLKEWVLPQCLTLLLKCFLPTTAGCQSLKNNPTFCFIFPAKSHQSMKTYKSLVSSNSNLSLSLSFSP